MEIRLHTGKKGSFFITTPINAREVISFSRSGKDAKVLKQVLLERKPFPRKPHEAFERVILRDRKLAAVEEVKSLDLKGKHQWNGEVWETVWEKPIRQDLAELLLHFSDVVLSKRSRLDKHEKDLVQFESLLQKALAEQIVQILKDIKK